MGENDGSEVKKSFLCDSCPYVADNESSLRHHVNKEHRGKAKMNKLREGTEMDDLKTVVNDEGYEMLDETKKPVDIWNALRRILFNTGIKSARETIVELFQNGTDAADIDGLGEVMALADIDPNKIKLVQRQWKNYIDRTGLGAGEEDGMDDFSGMNRSPVRNKKGGQTDDLFDFNPEKFANQMMRMQQSMYANAIKMQMFKDMMGQMSMMGAVPTANAQAAAQKLPPELEAALLELRQYKEEDKIKRLIEPVVREVRQYRNEIEDATKNKGQNPMLGEMMQYAAMSKAFESMGARESAEMAQTRANERMEALKIQTDREMKELAMKMEATKDTANRLQMEKMQTEMNAKLDLLRQANEIATQSKSADVIAVIKQAQETAAALKAVGASPEDAENKNLENISELVKGTIQSLAPVAQAYFTRGQQPQMQQPAAYPQQQPQYPQQQQRPTNAAAPPNPGHEMVIVHCPNGQCNKDFQQDLSVVNRAKPLVTCPYCQSVLELEPIGPPAAGQKTPPTLPTPPPALIQQKKVELASLSPQQLDDVARQFGIDPSPYLSNRGKLVDDLIRAAYGSS